MDDNMKPCLGCSMVFDAFLSTLFITLMIGFYPGKVNKQQKYMNNQLFNNCLKDFVFKDDGFQICSHFKKLKDD